ncbi:heavy metal-associated isoprenylated plant protein 6-like [Primulina huaijiensis]|uniref:heavy metal-associated isoprenylated plant protein 6-like n=1 Tax=Primulina huaijiensis TaxID=1492673 RepID=UPI003CC75587
MGEKDDQKKSDGEKAPTVTADGGGKKEEGPNTVVLKLDLHCEGCAKKVRRYVNHFEGVEKVKADWGANKLTVTGNVDPSWLRERVEVKTKKKVELISPQPKKDGGGDKKSDEKPAEKKAEEKKAEEKKPKEPVVSNVVMKLTLHCDGCATKIKRIILKHVEGVNSVTTDVDKDLITLIGTMEPKEVQTYLHEKLKRPVEIIPPPKKDDGADPEKKGKEGDGGDMKDKAESGGGDKKDKEISGGGDKKEKESGGGEKKEGGGDKKEAGPKADGEEKKVEVNKIEFQGYNPQIIYAMPPMYNQNYSYQDHYGAQMYNHQGYPNTGYMVQYTNGPPPPPPTYVNDQIFSDENPNGCFVM